MVKKILIAMLAAAAALALGGCGAAADDETVAAELVPDSWVGVWHLVEMEQDGEITDSGDFEALKALGYEFCITVNDDGTASFKDGEETLEGAWKAKSEEAGTFRFDCQEYEASVSGGELMFERVGAKLTFRKDMD